ncbi:MAG: glycosyltransferase family 9 protein [Candidatus Omnitrophota bacterium]|nr:glycosyltransferase family 9 protein [Candidatus Omnitrophota bacterium]
MPLDKSKVHKILVISLSNIGDVIASFPVVDILCEEFPEAKISMVVGPKAKSLFHQNPYLDTIYFYDKHQSLREKIRWTLELRRQNFDLVIDLRFTVIPFFLKARYRTFVQLRSYRHLHMVDKHLERLKTIVPDRNKARHCYALFIPDEAKEHVRRLREQNVGEKGKFAVIAPGAADHRKRWHEEGFAEVCTRLEQDYQCRPVFVGNEHDHALVERIARLMKKNVIDFCGQTRLIELAELLKYSALAIVNDSSAMHLASYLDIPTVALYGPTEPIGSHPWSSRARYIRKNQQCVACQTKQLDDEHTCMHAISGSEVWKLIEDLQIFKK